MTFEKYLINKKIDGVAFRKAESALYDKWKNEFEQMHPNSFTIQKLNLINPLRRKYLLLVMEATLAEKKPTDTSNTPVTSGTLRPKPIFKPKPKT